jgi:hypothetical protein
VAELGQHPADFAILPLSQDQFEDSRVAPGADRPDALGPDLPFGQPDAFDELVEDFPGGRAGYHDPVQLFDAVAGVGQLVGQVAVVGQKHQADAHLVEPADRVDPLGDLGQEVEDPRAARGVVVGRDVPFGFVDCEVDRTFDLHLLPVDRHRRFGRVDLGAQLANHLAAGRDAPLEDQLLAGPPRPDARMGENFLKSLRTRRVGRAGAGWLRTGGACWATRWLGGRSAGSAAIGGRGPARAWAGGLRSMRRLTGLVGIRAASGMVPRGTGTLRGHGLSDLLSAIRLSDVGRPGPPRKGNTLS